MPVLGSARRRDIFRAWRRVIGSGLGTDRCLDLVGAARGVSLEPGLARLRDGVRSGRSLEDQRALLVEVFGAAEAALLAAGERGGSLDRSLEAAATLAEEEISYRRRAAMALAYPALLVAAAFVLLPLPTLVGEGFLAAVFRWWLPGALFASVPVAVLGAAWTVWRRRGEGRRSLERVILAVPGLGRLLRLRAGRGFFGMAGPLLDAGLSLGEVLEAAAPAAGILLLGDAAVSAAASARAGASLGSILKGLPALPADAVVEVAVGEESGALPEACGALAQRYGDEASGAATVLGVALGVAVTLAAMLVVVVGVIRFYAGYLARIDALVGP
jgi:type IV pilus assembly protein PilC